MSSYQNHLNVLKTLQNENLLQFKEGSIHCKVFKCSAVILYISKKMQHTTRLNFLSNKYI